MKTADESAVDILVMSCGQTDGELWMDWWELWSDWWGAVEL